MPRNLLWLQVGILLWVELLSTTMIRSSGQELEPFFFRTVPGPALFLAVDFDSNYQRICGMGFSILLPQGSGVPLLLGGKHFIIDGCS